MTGWWCWWLLLIDCAWNCILIQMLASKAHVCGNARRVRRSASYDMDVATMHRDIVRPHFEILLRVITTVMLCYARQDLRVK